MMAIREGMIGLATADSGRSPKHVAPFGGREPPLGTNPISIAVPSDLEAPFYLDMATSAVAAALAIVLGVCGVPPLCHCILSMFVFREWVDAGGLLC